MSPPKRPAPDPIPDHPANVGAKVQPDGATKRNVGLMYLAAMGLMGFLALQVWTMNGRMAAIEANDRAQEKGFDRLEGSVNALRQELSEQIEGLRAELREAVKEKKG